MTTNDHEKRKLQRDKFLEFILGGNAHVTFKNSETGNRYTYKIKLSRNKKVYFVSTLIGMSNDSDYLYIGIIEYDLNYLDRAIFRWTKGSRAKEDDTRVKVFKYVFGHIKLANLPECVEVWHEGRCCRCGRLLTVPESIESGIGPECAKIMSFA